ncbi:MAG: winged helix-turn-helix domain-containing protein [Acholeplasmataceae bacterium]
MRRTVLLVEDEGTLLKLMRTYYLKGNFDVLEAKDGFSALDIFEKNRVDLVVLDVMLENSDGWSVCRKIREKSQVPILFLTARKEESDKLFGFELGADDYMTKPFSLKELLARSEALLKRGLRAKSDVTDIGSLRIDNDAHRVYVREREIALSPTEYDLLVYLAEHRGTALTREQLLINVWGYDYFGDLRTVDTHIKRLRKKIEPLDYIETVFGVGYRFEVPS